MKILFVCISTFLSPEVKAIRLNIRCYTDYIKYENEHIEIRNEYKK